LGRAYKKEKLRIWGAAMDAIEAIMKRRSARSYRRDPIPMEKLRKVLEAARVAPSAENRQPWYFVVVTDQEKIKSISKTGRFASFIGGCPAVIVGCSDPKASPKWHVVDTAIAMENMVIAATAEGLGTCWVGSFDEGRVKELLKIPDRLRVIAMLALGYPKRKTDLTGALLHVLRRRKRLSEIVGLNEYGRPLY